MADAPQIGRTGRGELLAELERAHMDIATLRAECNARPNITTAQARAAIDRLDFFNDSDEESLSEPWIPVLRALREHAKGAR